MLCAKFGWNWPSSSGGEDFFNFVNVFSLFRNYLPLEKGRALHLNKLEFPLPKDALCQVWLKLAQWFWRRRWKCEKFTTTTTTTTTTTDKFWSEKLTWAFGSGELKISDWVLMSQHIMKFIDRNSWKSIWVRIRVYLSIWWSTWMRKITETNDNTNILLGWSFF